MTPQQNSESLMNALLPLAEKMLREYGEFYPFGGYMKPDGNIVVFGAVDPDTDHPKSKDLLYVLRSSLQETAHRNECKATAVVFGVAVTPPSSTHKSDAIQVCIEHADGYSAEVFFPYRLVDGEIVYEEVFAQQGKHDIFAVS